MSKGNSLQFQGANKRSQSAKCEHKTEFTTFPRVMENHGKVSTNQCVSRSVPQWGVSSKELFLPVLLLSS